MDNSATKISKAKAKLVFKEPFFGSLLLQMRVLPIDDALRASVPGLEQCDTMATDGSTIYYDDSFVESQSVDANATVLVHEVFHIVLDHPFRVGDREPQKANFAMDFAVNNPLDTMGKWTWPVDAKGNRIGLIDHQFDDMSFEKIYTLLPDQKAKGQKSMGMVLRAGAGGSDGKGQNEGSGQDKEGGGGGEIAQRKLGALRDSIRGKILQAATIARRRGNLPGCIEQIIGKTLHPEIHWTERLKQFAQAQPVKTNYRWHRPNKSIYAATRGELILPSLDGKGMGEIVVGRDTSGSIYCMPNLAARFMGEIKSIHEECKPSKLHLVDVDASVQASWEFSRNDQVESMKMRGGGGTAFEPLFEFVEESDINPACLIYFTDMYGSFPPVAPPYPVLWVSYSDVSVAPFGDVVVVGKDERN